MQKFQLYLFDFDGTLFDTLASSVYVFKEAFKRKDVELKEEDILHYTRVPIPETYRKIVPSFKEEDINPFLDMITELVNSNESNKRISIYEDTYDFVLDLKMSEAILGIVTSNNEKHVKDVLKMFDMDFGLFDVIVGNETVKETKPDPTPILTALKRIQEPFTLDEVVYVGDAINDVLAAQNAGIDGIILDRHNEYAKEKYTRIQTLEELLK